MANYTQECGEILAIIEEDLYFGISRDQIRDAIGANTVLAKAVPGLSEWVDRSIDKLEVKNEAKKLIEAGMTVPDVAKKLKMKSCSNLYQWFGKDPVLVNIQEEKTCPGCGEVFISSKKNQKYCSKKCCKRANKITSSHRRRVRQSNQIVDVDITLEAVYKKESGVCYLCGMKCNFDDFIIVGNKKIVGDWYPSIDHVIPLCKGGKHSWENVRLAHRKCNALKSAEDRR